MPVSLKHFLERWIITTVGVLVAAHIVAGISYNDNFAALIVSSLLLGVLNAFLRPVMLILSLPLVVLTFGLFALVINALLLYFVGWLVEDFSVQNFWAAFWGALIISIVSLIANSIFGTGDTKIHVRRVPRKRNHNDDRGNGPVIDV